MRLRHVLLAVLFLPLLSPAFTARNGNDCGQLSDAEKPPCFQEIAAGRSYQQRLSAAAAEPASASVRRSSLVETTQPVDSTLRDTVISIVVGPKGDTTRTTEIQRSDIRKKDLVVAYTRLANLSMGVMVVGLVIGVVGLIVSIAD